MMYVYYTENLNEETTKKITDNGNAVIIDPDENMYLLSKTDKISVDGKVIDYSCSLDDYIEMFDGGDSITLAGIEVTMMESIQILLGELYQPCNDEGITYAERIYKSTNPYMEIKKLINEFLLVSIDIVMTDIQMKVDLIKKQVENGTLNWE